MSDEQEFEQEGEPSQTDNSIRPEDGEQDVSQDPAAIPESVGDPDGEQG